PLPLHPPYSRTTTGASGLYCQPLGRAGESLQCPTALVFEYAPHPLYVQSLSKPIDDGHPRFPHGDSDKLHPVFSTRGMPLKEMKKRRDPYCCLIHATVQEVMNVRAEKEQRPFHVAFQSKVGPAEWLTPSTPDKLEELASQGYTAVLIVPVAFVTDHVETAYELDIEVREEAEHFGIEHYEVTSGLNCHPLFIEALAESVAAQVAPAGAIQGDGAANVLPQPIPMLPRYKAKHRSVRCHQCPCV